MNALLVAVLTLSAAAPPEAARVETIFKKVAPAEPATGRTPRQSRAVVLIHGLSVSPLNKDRALHAIMRSWQLPDSLLVKELVRHADVYALAYGQNTPVEQVPEATGLPRHIRALRKAGYREVVLVGHSAGGLVARHFVEDDSEAGVTKVIQICTPNLGAGLASIRLARDVQKAFFTSLSRAARKAVLAKREDLRIPARIEFACVVGKFQFGGDGVVSCASQWSEDLQKQGIPAHLLRSTHWDAVRAARGVELIGRLVREHQPRWKDEEVSKARKLLLGS
jgi:pimeloyl-ACP methyl ester carboxylesterase